MSDPSDIYAWHRLDGRVTSSGQPTEVQLAALRDLGVLYVINLGLHTHKWALQDESASVEALGMTYIHIPVQFDAPTDSDFAEFRAAMETSANTKIHVHCIVNARVSAFLYRYRTAVLEMEEPRARADLEEIWRPGGVWAEFIGDEASIPLPHRPWRKSA